MRRVFLLALLSVSCAGPSVRFQSRAILWHWPDDRPIKQPPAEHLTITWEGVRDAIFAPLDRVLTIDTLIEAGNVNALDELPDSAWFKDPRRVDGDPRPRHLSDEEIARGALGPDDDPVLPFTVSEGKGIGATPGFVARDARGVKYLVKLDPKSNPGLTTSAEIVVNRLAYASGWLVPGLALIDARRQDVKLSPKAHKQNSYSQKEPLSEDELQKLLDKAPWFDGRTRMLASRWIEGENVGEYAYQGVRKNDPNDLVAHEDRRDLRALGTFCAWVNNVDTEQNNTLDMYQGKAGQGHIVHFAQDLGGAFGNFAGEPEQWWIGSETYFQSTLILRSMVTLGLWPRVWDDRAYHERKNLIRSTWPELGNFDAERFDPRHWQPILENAAFVRQTARDHYWAAKRIIAFDERELRAAIAVGKYRPEAAARLFDILWQRREKIARAFLGDVAPLDYFRFEGDALCFDDLWLTAGLAGTAQYHSNFSLKDRCVSLPARDGYSVVELGVRREGQRKTPRPVHVHVVTQGSTRRIVGIER